MPDAVPEGADGEISGATLVGDDLAAVYARLSRMAVEDRYGERAPMLLFAVCAVQVALLALGEGSDPQLMRRLNKGGEAAFAKRALLQCSATLLAIIGLLRSELVRVGLDHDRADHLSNCLGSLNQAADALERLSAAVTLGRSADHG